MFGQLHLCIEKSAHLKPKIFMQCRKSEQREKTVYEFAEPGLTEGNRGIKQEGEKMVCWEKRVSGQLV